jgi:hypothetical protein
MEVEEHSQHLPLTTVPRGPDTTAVNRTIQQLIVETKRANTEAPPGTMGQER